jgi:hypothetical protein
LLTYSGENGSREAGGGDAVRSTLTAVSGEDLAPRTASTVAVMTGGPPGSNNLVRDVLVQWVNGATLSGNDG